MQDYTRVMVTGRNSPVLQSYCLDDFAACIKEGDSLWVDGVHEAKVALVHRFQGEFPAHLDIVVPEDVWPLVGSQQEVALYRRPRGETVVALANHQVRVDQMPPGRKIFYIEMPSTLTAAEHFHVLHATRTAVMAADMKSNAGATPSDHLFVPVVDGVPRGWVGSMAEHVEALAALEHDQWAHWTRYFLANLTPENIARWTRQCETPYAELTEAEKASDREWAQKVVDLVYGSAVEARKKARSAPTVNFPDTPPATGT